MKQRWGVVLGIALAGILLAGQWFHTKLYVQTISSQEEAGDTNNTSDAGVIDGKQDEDGKVAYLTFDDGPSELTGKYLDILKRHNARATFFLIGQQIEGDMEEVIRREIEEGHEVGIHTFTHVSGQIYQSADSYYEDACKVRDLLQQKFQYNASVWRFPWGSSNCYLSGFKKEIVDRLQGEGLEYVDWNVSGEDSVGTPSSSTILANIRKNCFQVESPVILLHDSGSNQATLDILESVITMLEEQGYQFATVSEREKNCHFGEYN